MFIHGCHVRFCFYILKMETFHLRSDLFLWISADWCGSEVQIDGRFTFSFKNFNFFTLIFQVSSR